MGVWVNTAMSKAGWQKYDANKFYYWHSLHEVELERELRRIAHENRLLQAMLNVRLEVQNWVPHKDTIAAYERLTNGKAPDNQSGAPTI